MITQLASVLSGGAITKYLMMGLIGVTLTTGGLWLYARGTVHSLETVIEQKKGEIVRLTTEVETAQLSASLQEQAARELTKRIEKERIEAEELRAQLEDIANAPDSDDGPVADVLRRAVDGLPN